jgi:hypothetical protein
MTTPLSFHEKLVRLQTELVAPKGNYNSFGKYNYRSCEDILAAIKPYLKELKLTIKIQDEIVVVGDRYYIKATVRIADSDQWSETSAYARESFDKKGMDDAQVTGSASSYARKYALSGLLGIDDEEDPDRRAPLPDEVKTNDTDRFKKDSSRKLDEYVVKVGKIKDRKFGELTKEEIQGTLTWALGNIQNPSGNWKEFIDTAREYLR